MTTSRDAETRDLAWSVMIKAIADWADNHMDQHEMFRMKFKYGELYVTLSKATEYPDHPEFRQLIVP